MFPPATFFKCGQTRYSIEAMRSGDISAVVAIEMMTFSNPWSVGDFEHEIMENQLSHPTVVLMESSKFRCIVGYSVTWIIVDELHIQNIAVHPAHQRTGLGRIILEKIFESGRNCGAAQAFLEVRESNKSARNLYASTGFREVGRRRGYYSRPPEDAIAYRRNSLDI